MPTESQSSIFKYNKRQNLRTPLDHEAVMFFSLAFGLLAILPTMVASDSFLDNFFPINIDDGV